jgi:trk system potassium uptake protein TrkA
MGAYLAGQFDGEGHNVTVVDMAGASFKRLGDDFGGTMMIGNGTDQKVLRNAGVESADAFASVSQGDNRNIMMALMAKDVFGVKRVMTRVYDPIRAKFFEELGLTTFCPTTESSLFFHEYFVHWRER